jgi:hypothetical protein
MRYEIKLETVNGEDSIFIFDNDTKKLVTSIAAVEIMNKYDEIIKRKDGV